MLLRNGPFSHDDGKRQDKMGINQNAYMHAVYIFSGGLNKTYIIAVSDNAAVTIESGCTWTITGNCTISSLTNNGAINFNGYTITLEDGTVLS